MQDIFERLESEVRTYSRAFPTTFRTGKGAYLTDASGEQFLDFFAGAGALNYGHNNDAFKPALLDYIERDGITHSLDMQTEAKETFLEVLETHIFKPRHIRYKVQFTGPTGTNAVEAAFKLARKATGRSEIIAFTNGFHGLTLGSLAATGNETYRNAAGAMLIGSTRMPFDRYHGPGVNTAEILRRYLEDASSGVHTPAAIVLETVQAEGGIHVASKRWLREIAQLAKDYGILLIVDDIQVGCGRTGTFFSFDEIGIEPDIVCLSKSLSGYGLPLAVVLIKPEHDVWEPGEHTGTFRGHNLAFVTGRVAIETYWRNSDLTNAVAGKAAYMRERLEAIAAPYRDGGVEVRGRGLIQGIDLAGDNLGNAVSKAAFERGLIIETAGANNEVVKCLPPLTIKADDLGRGLEIVGESVKAVMN